MAATVLSLPDQVRRHHSGRPRTRSSSRGCYFEAGGVLKLGTSLTVAFKMALETWASWVKERIDLRRTRVFFRTYEPSHWSHWCLPGVPDAWNELVFSHLLTNDCPAAGGFQLFHFAALSCCSTHCPLQ